MRKSLITIILLIVQLFLSGQNVDFDKSNFPGRKEELKEASKKFDAGSELYLQGRREFEEFKRIYLLDHKYLPASLHDYRKAGNVAFKSAMPLLNDAHRFNPNNTLLNYMLGFILLFEDPLNPATIKHFEAASSLGGEVEPDVVYWLAWAHHLNSHWDQAAKFYDQYLKSLSLKSKTNALAIEDANKKIAECKIGKDLSAKPERVFIDNLGPTINTGFPEYGPSISADEETIFFTSRRPNSLGNKRDAADNGYYEDIYFSVKVNGQWQAAKQLSKNVNTEGHDAAAGLSADGSKLYVFRSTPSDRGDLYESTLFGLDWERPVQMNKYINTKYHESTVSLSFDGKRVYFVSERESGLGDGDIYYCDLDVNGNWGPSKNIGPEINTKYGEDAVFMHPDGVTMFFSSKGHGSMGGYDVFKTTLVNGKWQTPVNLGYPINGPDNDVFFVVGGSGNRGYFASAKAGGLGDYDLYKITFLGPEKEPLTSTQDQLISIRANPVSDMKVEKPIETKSARLTLLKGIVKDAKTGKPLESTIDLIDNEKNLVLASFKSNSSTGKYLVTLPSGKNYGIVVKAEGYLFHSENFKLAETAEFQEHNIDIGLQKLEVGNTVVLRNIFFDSDKSSVRSESANELDRLVKLLQDNPTAKVEIGSHTDDQGSSEYNQKLSEDRSKAVVEYLTSKGVSSSRLVSKGYGETQFLEANTNENGRQANRRTEFKILSK